MPPAAYLKKKKTIQQRCFSNDCIFHIKTAQLSMLFARRHFLCKHFSSDDGTFVTLTMEIFNNKKTCQICDWVKISLSPDPPDLPGLLHRSSLIMKQSPQQAGLLLQLCVHVMFRVPSLRNNECIFTFSQNHLSILWTFNICI